MLSIGCSGDDAALSDDTVLGKIDHVQESSVEVYHGQLLRNPSGTQPKFQSHA